MPRTQLETRLRLEYLSVLDEDDNLDADLEPELDDETLRSVFETMLLSRRLDQRMLSMQRQGRLGTFAPAVGQEASQVGAVLALEKSDWMVPSYRETPAALWRGLPMKSLLLFNAGFQEGAAIPEGAHDLPICIPVGSQLLHAAGLGYGLRQKGQDAVVLTFFGDGATSEGDFHEALNFAGVFECPVVFVCQNNQWAISVPRSHQTRAETLAQKAHAYGLPGLQVDGNDVLGVYVACDEAVRRARDEGIPTLIECLTYRMTVHTTVDDPSKYRDEEEVEAWKRRDPLPRFERYLVERKGIMSQDDVESMTQEVERRIDEAVDDAESEMETLAEDPGRMFEHLSASPPPTLAAQRREFEAHHG